MFSKPERSTTSKIARAKCAILEDRVEGEAGWHEDCTQLRRTLRLNTGRQCWPPASSTALSSATPKGDTCGSPNHHRNSFKPILRRAALPDVRFYDVPHTSTTLLLLADVAAKVVSEQLGHSSIMLTLDTHSHVLPTMQKRGADLIGKLLGREVVTVANGGTMAVQRTTRMLV